MTMLKTLVLRRQQRTKAAWGRRRYGRWARSVCAALGLGFMQTAPEKPWCSREPAERGEPPAPRGAPGLFQPLGLSAPPGRSLGPGGGTRGGPRVRGAGRGLHPARPNRPPAVGPRSAGAGVGGPASPAPLPAPLPAPRPPVRAPLPPRGRSGAGAGGGGRRGAGRGGPSSPRPFVLRPPRLSARGASVIEREGRGRPVGRACEGAPGAGRAPGGG